MRFVDCYREKMRSPRQQNVQGGRDGVYWKCGRLRAVALGVEIIYIYIFLNSALWRCTLYMKKTHSFYFF